MKAAAQEATARAAALAAALLTLAAVLVIIAAWRHGLQHWLAYMTGSLNTPGTPPDYNFWSGFGSDLGEFAIAGALIQIVRRHNCHARQCWRIGRYPVQGTSYRVCSRHHPDGPASADQIHQRYRQNQERGPGNG